MEYLKYLATSKKQRVGLILFTLFHIAIAFIIYQNKYEWYILFTSFGIIGILIMIAAYPNYKSDKANKVWP